MRSGVSDEERRQASEMAQAVAMTRGSRTMSTEEVIRSRVLWQPGPKSFFVF